MLITYIGPIVLVSGLSFIKEIWDEIKRKIKDDKFNKEKFTILKDNMKYEIES